MKKGRRALPRRPLSSDLGPRPSALGSRLSALGSTTLLHEQHFAISRQRPEILRRDPLERVADLTQGVHGRNHLVAEVLRVLFRLAVALVLEQLLQLVD